LFLYGPASLPLAVSDGSESVSVSMLFDTSQLNASAMLVPLNSQLTIDVNSLSSLQGGTDFLFITLSAATCQDTQLLTHSLFSQSWLYVYSM